MYMGRTYCCPASLASAVVYI